MKQGTIKDGIKLWAGTGVEMEPGDGQTSQILVQELSNLHFGQLLKSRFCNSGEVTESP